MAKAKLRELHRLDVEGIFDLNNMIIEVDGEVKNIRELLEKFDGENITLVVQKEK